MYLFSNLKYGVFVHYIAKHGMFPTGEQVTTWEDTVNLFDVERFAEDMQKMHAQYVIFTAWHYRMMPLYPSAVTEKWRPGCSSPSRDLLGEIIDAVNARGIRVILYTHPRDGHDFTEEDRQRTGWGNGNFINYNQTPNPDTFDYTTWNQYIQELYTELMEKYGDRIIGIYTDGMGAFDSHQQIVDYPALRRIVKHKNPELCMIQNFWGLQLSNDFVMPEAFFNYEHTVGDRMDTLPACNKALAACPFGDWAARNPRGVDARKGMLPDEMARFTLFNASCTMGGGCCWAYGPYNDGTLEDGVLELMQEVGEKVSAYAESTLNAIPSTSFPTVSGDTLESLHYRFFTSSADRAYEYLNLMKLPEDGIIILPEAADGAVISAPVSLDPNVNVVSFEDGKLVLSGTPSGMNTVIRFSRQNNPQANLPIWLNNTDKRFKYRGEWEFNVLETWKYRVLDTKEPSGLGCYEADYQFTDRAGDSFFLAFEGSRIELYGVKSPGGGTADVLIDGAFAGVIDEKAPERTVRELCFQSDDLCGGWHTVEVILTANKLFTFDAARIYR